MAIVGTCWCLLLTGAAYAARSRTLRGRSSQGERISLRLSGGFVRGLQYFVLDKCPGGVLLRNHDYRFPPLQVAHSRFGGRFVDGKVAAATVRGKVSRHAITGELIDRRREPTGRAICHGRATFRVARR